MLIYWKRASCLCITNLLLLLIFRRKEGFFQVVITQRLRLSSSSSGGLRDSLFQGHASSHQPRSQFGLYKDWRPPIWRTDPHHPILQCIHELLEHAF